MARGRKGTAELELTPEIKKDLTRVLNMGLTVTDACKFAGCSKASFYKWLSIGKGRPKEDILRQFADEVAKAETSAKVAAIGYVYKGMAKDWKAAAWYLGVTRPKEYGPKIRVTLETEFDAALERLEKALPPEMYEKALAAIAGGEGEEEDSGPSPGDIGPRLQ